jgi:hypothetical protein
MKKLLTPLLLCGLTSSLLAGASTGGPFANGAYYSGYLNGRYMGVVTGNNIAGVLGFAIVDGAPPFRTRTEAESASASSVKVEEYGTPDFDVTQNYFAIFVEGRTYTGITAAGIDIDNNTVAGALQGTDPIAVQAAVRGAPGPAVFNTGITTFQTNRTPATVGPTNDLTNVIITNVVITREPPAFNNALSILNRGLSGGFTAKIKSKNAVFTFKGDGQLSTPANSQSYTASGYVEEKLPDTAPITAPAGSLTNLYVTGQYQTESTHFQVRGIRMSFNSLGLQAAIDSGAASGAASSGASGGAAN